MSNPATRHTTVGGGNVSLWRDAVDKRPCTRCGLPIWKSNADMGVCVDCREADPVFVQAVTVGVRCA